MAVPVGPEHNGSAIKFIYLKAEDRGKWSLGPKDYYGEHAPMHEHDAEERTT